MKYHIKTNDDEKFELAVQLLKDAKAYLNSYDTENNLIIAYSMPPDLIMELEQIIGVWVHQVELEPDEWDCY